MKASRTTCLLTCALLTLGACNQSKEDPAPANKIPVKPIVVTKAPTKTELLTGKNWVLTASTIVPAYYGATDLYAKLTPCDRDDLMRFEVGGVYRLDEGATKCDAGDPQQYYTGTWAFQSNETQLVLNSNTPSYYTCKLLSLTEKELKFSYERMESGVLYTITRVYTKQ